MMNSKGFLVRSAKGLNDCTGGYNNFTDLKGFFQLVKQITSSESDIMANDTPVQKLTFHLFISYLLYMSGSQRTVLIQKGDCSRIKNKKTDTDDYLLTLCQ